VEFLAIRQNQPQKMGERWGKILGGGIKLLLPPPDTLLLRRRGIVN